MKRYKRKGYNNKNITDEIKKRIIKLHFEGKGPWEISIEILPERDLSIVTINNIIREYYESIGKTRTKYIRRKEENFDQEYDIKEVEKQLIEQLKKGRPAKYVYRIAEKFNIPKEDLIYEEENDKTIDERE